MSSNEQFSIDTAGEYIFSDCLFHFFISGLSNGGVIFCTRNEISLKLNSCTFFNCTTYREGGGIYFYSFERGSVEIYKMCVSQCFCFGDNNRFQFGYFYVDKNGNNTHRSVSVSSRYLGSNSTYNYYIQHGNVFFQNSNFSKNHLKYYVTITFVLPSVSKISYCSFNDNFASGSVFLSIQGNQANVRNINVINNSLKEKMGYVYYQDGQSVCNITNSSFGKNMEFLFGVFGYSSLFVEFCIIEHENNWLTFGQVNITQCFYTHRVDIHTYDIEGYFTQYCDSGVVDRETEKKNGAYYAITVLVMIFCLLYFINGRKEERWIEYDRISVDNTALWESTI